MGIGSVLSAISFAKDVIAPKSKSKSGFIENVEDPSAASMGTVQAASYYTNIAQRPVNIYSGRQKLVGESKPMGFNRLQGMLSRYGSYAEDYPYVRNMQKHQRLAERGTAKVVQSDQADILGEAEQLNNRTKYILPFEKG